MTPVKTENNIDPLEINIGDKLITTKAHRTFCDVVPKGAEVIVTGVSARGYDIETRDGICLRGIGWRI